LGGEDKFTFLEFRPHVAAREISARASMNHVGSYITNFAGIGSPRHLYRYDRKMVSAGIAYHYTFDVKPKKRLLEADPPTPGSQRQPKIKRRPTRCQSQRPSLSHLVLSSVLPKAIYGAFNLILHEPHQRRSRLIFVGKQTHESSNTKQGRKRG
jgi:hypothetical protein